jgi:hypothetical protein
VEYCEALHLLADGGPDAVSNIIAGPDWIARQLLSRQCANPGVCDDDIDQVLGCDHSAHYRWDVPLVIDN